MPLDLIPPTLFRRACLGQPVERVPAWLMRQAGRYMQEYQAVRARAGGFWELCTNPELAAQATLDAARYLGTDAAIIFSDITAPAWAMGLPLVFEPGPKFTTPVRTLDDVRRLKPVDPKEKLGFVLEAIRRTRRELPKSVSLIGFVGAPLTLAGYMIEGDPSRSWAELKRLAYGEPKTMHQLLERVAETVTAHAAAQAEAGCDALQIFDTTAGELAAEELHAYAFHYARKVVEGLRPLGVPIIYFARNVGAHLAGAADVGADVLGVDWTTTLSEARRLTGERSVLMGNLDPTVLLTSEAEIQRRVDAILAQAQGLKGYVFNLGHGVLPPTPPKHALAAVRAAQRFAWRR